jgi:RNA polymerase subunit RPABC4/transcription elongation factor Spt4
MRRFLFVPLLLSLHHLPKAAVAESGLAGDWIMTSVNIKVAVESWGTYCGARPGSYSNGNERPVTIRESGGHLIFSEGGIRTDRCGSPNPKIKTVLARRSETRWRRECQTTRDDPKFERGIYTLTAVNSNRLEYTAESRFDWTLKGDHCVATAAEKRVFIRKQKKPPTVASGQETPKTPPSEPEPPTELVDTGAECVAVGPIVHFMIEPANATVGPGERFCFRVDARDAAGCAVKNPNLTWTVSQDNVAIKGLITRGGCFTAGETAAETEGLYTVSVQSGHRTATAEITVVFDDLGALFAARLRPLSGAAPPPLPREVASPTSQPLENTAPVSPGAGATPISPKPGNVTGAAPAEAPHESRAALWVILIGLILGGIVIGAILVLRRLQRLPRASDELDDDWLDQDDADDDDDDDNNNDKRAPSTPDALTCPECHRLFKRTARFCPYDKSVLISISRAPRESPEGMICPRCHRGYEMDARFCPHDSEPLVPYADWRITRKPNSGR